MALNFVPFEDLRARPLSGFIIRFVLDNFYYSKPPLSYFFTQ